MYEVVDIWEKLDSIGLGSDCCIIHFTDHTISVRGYIYHTQRCPPTQPSPVKVH